MIRIGLLLPPLLMLLLQMLLLEWFGPATLPRSLAATRPLPEMLHPLLPYRQPVVVVISSIGLPRVRHCPYHRRRIAMASSGYSWRQRERSAPRTCSRVPVRLHQAARRRRQRHPDAVVTLPVLFSRSTMRRELREPPGAVRRSRAGLPSPPSQVCRWMRTLPQPRWPSSIRGISSTPTTTISSIISSSSISISISRFSSSISSSSRFSSSSLPPPTLVTTHRTISMADTGPTITPTVTVACRTIKVPPSPRRYPARPRDGPRVVPWAECPIPPSPALLT
mmetsp:Transcript_11835/g.24979  ORF Transcript_11835/g.24979 Transcript_11835/m.24979 type:complete len:280 (+) Transcript_11835:6297-7136(+)